MRIKHLDHPWSMDLGCNSTHNLPQLLFSVSEAKQKKKTTQAAEEQYISQLLHSRTSYKCLQQTGKLTPSLTSLKLTFLQQEKTGLVS